MDASVAPAGRPTRRAPAGWNGDCDRPPSQNTWNRVLVNEESAAVSCQQLGLHGCREPNGEAGLAEDVLEPVGGRLDLPAPSGRHRAEPPEGDRPVLPLDPAPDDAPV